ncbi:MAG: hypothetical protein M3268_07085 [Acidobacteriota bacterium]|nr:hypothetical protein [Acidobacteriota bacterium]
MAKELSEKEAAGMTVNERLWVAGLMDDFDRAVERRDVSAVRSILRRVYLDAAAIDANVDLLFREKDSTDN